MDKDNNSKVSEEDYTGEVYSGIIRENDNGEKVAVFDRPIIPNTLNPFKQFFLTSIFGAEETEYTEKELLSRQFDFISADIGTEQTVQALQDFRTPRPSSNSR